jgi:hypothetical protein
MAKLNRSKCGDMRWDCRPGCGVIEERINWIATTEDLPDQGVTVLLFTEGEGEPVWPGYFDEATAHGYLWRTADGSEIEGVTHWAEMPAGPGGK